MRICCSQLHCIKFNVPYLKSAWNSCEGTAQPDQTYPNAFRHIEPDTVVMIFKRLMSKKVLALRLRTSATWSASPLIFFSSLKSDCLIKRCIKNRQRGTQRQRTRIKNSEPPMDQSSPQERKKAIPVTATFQNDGFSPFPPGQIACFLR